MKDLLNLEPKDCRYVVDSELFLFCADPKTDRSSYCAKHHAICWVKPLPVKAKGPVRELA